MARGITACGDQVTRRFEHQYNGKVEHEVAVFYGLQGKMPSIFYDYKREAKAVYVDLGYWGRREGGRWTGYHKVAVNDRHPTTYYRARQHAPDRVGRFGLIPKPWRTKGFHILLCGMGDKGALAEGYLPEQWERDAIREIRKYTKRPIIYRPKPSWKTARPIDGVGYSAPHDKTLEQDLRLCHAVVTHHSNAAVDAIVEGIPAFCWGGVAAGMSSQDLSEIETPYFPTGRAEWIADIAYTQWCIAEMEAGRPWLHLKEEGLIP